MFAVQSIARRSPGLVSTLSQQIRKESIISTKPRVRVSFPEKVLHGLVLASIPFVIPIYVMTHLKVWNGRQEEE